MNQIRMYLCRRKREVQRNTGKRNRDRRVIGFLIFRKVKNTDKKKVSKNFVRIKKVSTFADPKRNGCFTEGSERDKNQGSDM